MQKLFFNQTECLAIITLLLFFMAGCESDKMDETSGIYFGLALEGLPDSASVFQDMEEGIGLSVSLVNFFLQWPQKPDFNNFPEETLRAVHEFGAVPVLTWEPMYYSRQIEYMIPVSEITGGRYDRYISLFAQKIRNLERPVIIRFAHEMNLSRYHWGGSLDEFGPESPERYISMFRHVAGIFKDQGVDNALFAFCPNNESLPSPKFDPEAGWNRAVNYYPGDDFVDVLGMDGYNWGSSQTLHEHGWSSRWLSFEGIFTDIYQELRSINPDKPVYVFETSSVRQGGNRNAWIMDALRTAGKWGLDGIVWFHADKEQDWRLTGFRDSEYYNQARQMIEADSLAQRDISD